MTEWMGLGGVIREYMVVLLLLSAFGATRECLEDSRPITATEYQFLLLPAATSL
jgi:hypothetical protein